MAELAAALTSTVRTGNSPAFERIASKLYDLLIAPIAGNLPPDVGLVFVTDKQLHEVPFAALLNRRTGRFLGQEHPLLVAASASTYCLGLRRTAAPGDESRDAAFTVLAVGNPEIDRVRYPLLGPLPAAGQEAMRTATFYPGSVVLSGSAATATRFLAEMDRHDLVQFAGHAVAGPAWRAKLVLAKPGGGAGAEELEAATIAGLRLHRPRLVILSACAAGSGPTAHLEGTLSLARAFLAAGTPAVLANLWTVEDDVAAVFSQRFHASFKQRRDALAALHSAQAALLASPDPRLHAPVAWAGFQLYGAAALAGTSSQEPAVGLSTRAHRPPLPPRSPPSS